VIRIIQSPTAADATDPSKDKMDDNPDYTLALTIYCASCFTRGAIGISVDRKYAIHAPSERRATGMLKFIEKTNLYTGLI